MPWIQTHLTVDKSQAPLIELLFENLGAVSITLGDAGDEPMLEPGPGETPLWQATRVTGLFSGDTDRDALRSTLDQSLQKDLARHLTVETLEDQDWERAWLERFSPLQFGERLWICPTGHTVTAHNAVVVDLDPGLAFGTGTHPTTALCLEWLDGVDLEGKTVIDFGCGSGVLAIAALKLGAKRAIGVDHDPQAILASRENAIRNQVSDKLDLFHSEEFSPCTADVVIANILANVLIDLQPQISQLIAQPGQLVLSGILEEQSDDVAQAYTQALSGLNVSTMDGWVRISGHR